MLRKVGSLLSLVFVMLLAAPALAGGWVVITLDALPAEIRAGEPLTIGFMVRQHGQTPTNGVSPTLHARNGTTGESISVGAQQSGETGHFVVEVVFPTEGQWEWSLTASPFPQEGQFAPLTVLPEAAPVADESAAPGASTMSVGMALRWSGMAILAVAVFLALVAMRRRDMAGVPAVGD